MYEEAEPFLRIVPPSNLLLNFYRLVLNFDCSVLETLSVFEKLEFISIVYDNFPKFLSSSKETLEEIWIFIKIKCFSFHIFLILPHRRPVYDLKLQWQFESEQLGWIDSSFGCPPLESADDKSFFS